MLESHLNGKKTEYRVVKLCSHTDGHLQLVAVSELAERTQATDWYASDECRIFKG